MKPKQIYEPFLMQNPQKFTMETFEIWGLQIG